ncbi:hypothetical protein DSO57_1001642 [Entomophthora muscae]|uniref:Uncharacterized protein n=1 Tax=Entomophthora muscae TaxID=34485 RepID=A0ACC2S054_9FUNG|nr:hypothetical protein DSO57_1001642 [Entomophthora muscae]
MSLLLGLAFMLYSMWALEISGHLRLLIGSFAPGGSLFKGVHACWGAMAICAIRVSGTSWALTKTVKIQAGPCPSKMDDTPSDYLRTAGWWRHVHVYILWLSPCPMLVVNDQ